MNILYFGYGSNMPKAVIEERVGPCERIGVAYITGYTLRFHKRSAIDHTGKCDAYLTGEPTDIVWGSVDRLSDHQIAVMDRIEGPGYRRVTVEATMGERIVEAHIYLARPEAVDRELSPIDSYKECVLTGARELDLPAAYVAAIEAVTSMPDPD